MESKRDEHAIREIDKRTNEFNLQDKLEHYMYHNSANSSTMVTYIRTCIMETIFQLVVHSLRPFY